MDGYAPAYVAHNVPLLLVSGLGPAHARQDEEGIRIVSEVHTVESDDAQILLRHLRDSDAGGLAWNCREYNGRNRFRVKVVGREYVLPNRSARPPEPSPRSHNSQGSSPVPRPILHSALSPLSPGSPVFPDGLLDPKWVEKHQDLVPSAYISFYTFTSDPKLATLHDNQLKTDINNVKRMLSQSGYKTRHIVALLSQGSIIKSPDVEDRLANIRKSTGLDSKTSLFFLPPRSSPVELQAFVETIISTIYPLSIEYYRDLSKHSRRKRNRGIVPPPTSPPTSGTSQTLSSQGWNVRYDFKLGVFAEFRQEMDAALRSYESGYDGLLGPDVLEAIASWSPRWNEARLLADVFAIRILRCLLWNGNSTAAVRRWQLHRERIRDFVDRRGKGSSTYGWEAWEARWATVMGEIITKASIADFSLEKTTFFLSPEKGITIGERLEPFEFLHHPGYWFRLASKHLLARRLRALAIPEEDRSPPGSSPASQIASKTYMYDTYLCPDPHEEYPLPGAKGVDHSLLIVESLTRAISEFEKRKQFRLVHELSLQSANESMRREDWDSAFHILRPLWQKMSFRKEGWLEAVEEVGWALRNAAVHTGDGGAIVAVDWELLNRSFVYHPKWHYDLTKSLVGVGSVTARPAVVLHDEEVLCFLSATFVFEHSEGKVGELCHSQLAVTSRALPASPPITIVEIRVEFEGSMKPLILQHKPSTEDFTPTRSENFLSTVSLSDNSSGQGVVSTRTGLAKDGRPMLFGTEDLTFRPGQTRVFEFSHLLREAGEANALSATFCIGSELFDLDYIQQFQGNITPDVWWVNYSANKKHSAKRVVRPNASAITILPKPPKLELRFIGLQEQYYTNENIMLKMEAMNGEEIDSVVDLDVRLLGDHAPAPCLKIATPSEEEVSSEANASTHAPEISIGRIARTESAFVNIIIPPIDLPATFELVMRASYHLVSDMETPISRSSSIQFAVINPFEANYDFSPRIHPDPWPSFFNHVETETAGPVARGLAQKWCLTSRYFSFAEEDLIVEDVDLELIGTNGAIQCNTKKATVIPSNGVRVSPKSLDEVEFDVFTQKMSLDDRGTATLDVSLAIRWRRDRAGSKSNNTILAVPRLLVSNSEPRVLAAVSYSATIASMVHFDVTIENPSNHFLTFGLSMEPSEKFAFSGVKQATLQLVPLSRRTMRFRLIPFLCGDWLGPIRCVIRDKYFQKVLKIAPTEGMKADKDGILVWVPPEEEEA